MLMSLNAASPKGNCLVPTECRLEKGKMDFFLFRCESAKKNPASLK